jgi:hypothetical protein
MLTCCQDVAQVLVPFYAICWYPLQYGQAVLREVPREEHVEARTRL